FSVHFLLRKSDRRRFPSWLNRGLWAQTQHSCYEGQSSEPPAVNLGCRDGRGPSVRLPKNSPLRPALRNHPQFQVVLRSLTPDSPSFASSFAHSAKWQPLSLPLVT